MSLFDLIALHGAETIAAVIVEPMAGSAGVLVPPVGYLERLRAICDEHGILLIFDEVITGFGRLGAPFAATYFAVQPDIVTLAKALTNGTVPMGAVAVREAIFDTFMAGPEGAIEFTHGYTYSGHPLACAAARAALALYQRDGLLTRAADLNEHWENAAHGLRSLPQVIDIRNIGLTAAIELAPLPGQPGGARNARPAVRVRAGRLPARHRRHHRPGAAADHHPGADRRAVRAGGGDH